MQKYFSLFYPRDIWDVLRAKRDQGQSFFFFTRYGIVRLRVLILDSKRCVRVYINVGGVRGRKYVRLECFLQSFKTCADTRDVRFFFPFHLIFNGRAHIRGLGLLFRGLEHARSPFSCTFTSSYFA